VLTRWVERVFDEKYTTVRLGLLALSGLGYLLVQPDPTRPLAPIDWAFGLTSVGLCAVCVRWPFAGSIAQSVVLMLAATFGHADPVVPQVGASAAIIELSIREGARRAVISASVLTALYVVHAIADPEPLVGWLFGVLIAVGVPLLLGINIRALADNMRAARKLARETEERAAVELKAARAGERTAIARELHDLVAHHVASMVLRVGVARHVLKSSDPRVQEVFDDLHASGTAALADLRQLVGVLRDPETVGGYLPLEPGALPDTLRATVDRAEHTGLSVDATIDPKVATLDAVRGLAILRLTQEGLTNVARHAGPTARARLSIEIVDGEVRWEIADDGGAAGPPRPAEPGHGLTGMRERVEVLGGALEAGPAGPGWRLRTTLPLAAP
jgi:signal transduction histidine kinase